MAGLGDAGGSVGFEKAEVLLSSMNLATAKPLPELSRTGENQVSLWVMKSPIMMVGAVGSRRRERLGFKLVGQEDEGGI